MNNNHLGLLVLTLALSSACSKLKEAGDMPATTKEMNTTTKGMGANMVEMKDITKEMAATTSGMATTTRGMSVTTNEMKDITEDMSKTTKDMAVITKEMKSVTTDMYIQLRSKESEATRAEKIAELKDPKSDLGTKITAACIYYKSFEYQLATLKEFKNDEHAMDEMRLDAVNEFTRRMMDLYKKVNVKKMSATKSGKKHNDELAFYAMAATMHMNHHFQMETAKKSRKETVSFLNIIETALTKEKNGEATKEYEDVLLTGMNREVAIELLKARVDIISAVALSYMTDKREMSLGSKIKAALFMGSKGKFAGISLPLTIDESNTSTQMQTVKALDAAIKTRRFLKSIGVEKQLEKNLRSAYSNLDLETVLESRRSEEGTKGLKEIDSLIKDLLK